MELKDIVWNALSKALAEKLKTRSKVIVPKLGTISSSYEFEPAVELQVSRTGLRPITSQSTRSNAGMLSLHQLGLQSYNMNDLNVAFEANLKELVAVARHQAMEKPFGSMGSFVLRNGELQLTKSKGVAKITEDGAGWLKTRLGIDLKSAMRSQRSSSAHSSRSRFGTKNKVINFVSENHAKF